MLFTRWFVAAAPLFALTALAPPWALAQGASAPSPDPLNADAAVPAVSAPRTFDGYHAYRSTDDKGPAPWRETNAAVTPKPGASEHGGHAGHSMPASAPAAAPAKPAGDSMPGMHHH